MSSTSYEDCVDGFAGELESMGWAGRLSALDLEIVLYEGDNAREYMKFVRAGQGEQEK